MSEQFDNRPENDSIYPEAPPQDIAAWIAAIMEQKGIEYGFDENRHIDASWDDTTNGRRLTLQEIVYGKTVAYRLAVTLADGSAVANLKYSPTKQHVTFHDSRWSPISGPSSPLADSMLEYLQTAPVRPSRGADSGPRIDKEFWSLAGSYVLTHPEVVEVLSTVSDQDTDMERYMKQERAMVRMRAIDSGLPEDSLYALIIQSTERSK